MQSQREKAEIELRSAHQTAQAAHLNTHVVAAERRIDELQGRNELLWQLITLQKLRGLSTSLDHKLFCHALFWHEYYNCTVYKNENRIYVNP